MSELNFEEIVKNVSFDEVNNLTTGDINLPEFADFGKYYDALKQSNLDTGHIDEVDFEKIQDLKRDNSYFVNFTTDGNEVKKS